MNPARPLVVPFEQLRMGDVAEVGGKNASLGEMIGELAGAGIRVPGGFATTATAFRDFLAHKSLAERIEARLRGLDVGDVRALTTAGTEIRRWIVETPLPTALTDAIASAFAKLTRDAPQASFAVRSSATA